MQAGPVVEEGKAPQQVLIETRKTDVPCCKCGRPIQPGQLYVPSPVRHFGCRP
jgi:hypothetical protein